MADKVECETCGKTDTELWFVKGKLFCYPDCYLPARDWCDAVAAEKAAK